MSLSNGVVCRKESKEKYSFLGFIKPIFLALVAQTTLDDYS